MKMRLMTLLMALLMAGVAFAAPEGKEGQKKAASQFGSLKDLCEKLPPKEGKWLSGPPGWNIHFRDAYEQSKREKKPILILQTGSDWCGYCIKLHKAVFDKVDFLKFSRKNLVLLYLDSPSEKKQPKAQEKHNSMVSKHFAFPGGYPMVRVVSSDGSLLGELSGFNGDGKAYLKRLQEMVRSDKAKSPAPQK